MTPEDAPHLMRVAWHSDDIRDTNFAVDRPHVMWAISPALDGRAMRGEASGGSTSNITFADLHAEPQHVRRDAAFAHVGGPGAAAAVAIFGRRLGIG